MFERMEELLDFEKPDLVRTIPGNLFPEYRAELPRVCFFGEPVCDPQLNSGLFNAMLECGDVMGVFCGHDHNNDYAINNRGFYWPTAGIQEETLSIMTSLTEDV